MKVKYILITIISIFALYSHGFSQNAISISQDMLTSLKMNQPITDFEKELADLPFEKLVTELDSDLKKQAFWINIYITYSQKLIAEYGTCDKACKRKKVITVANRVFSLNDILYRILLHSKSTITGGKKIISPKWEKTLHVNYPDGRILFAIAGNKQIADAITYYEPQNIDTQLNEVSMLFLKIHVFYKLDQNEVYLPKWIKHFKREFGKKTGIIRGLKRAQLVPEDQEPKIIFTDKIAELK
jgi:hypothetical protein